MYDKNHGTPCALALVVAQIKSDPAVPEAVWRVARAMARRTRLDSPNASPILRGVQAVAVLAFVKAMVSASVLRDLTKFIDTMIRSMKSIGVALPDTRGVLWPSPPRRRSQGALGPCFPERQPWVRAPRRGADESVAEDDDDLPNEGDFTEEDSDNAKNRP